METEREKIKVNVTNFSWVQETRGFGNDNFLCEKHSFFFWRETKRGREILGVHGTGREETRLLSNTPS
jgi:hypothetical protein